jgi:uncharacterized membrane protein YdbT with pleckstrin-like domain
MTDLNIRPSMKKVWATYAFCGLLFLAGCALYGWQQPANWPPWVTGLPLLLFVWPLILHVSRSFTLLSVSGGRLRYQTGMLSRSVRTMDLGRLQDVRVDQTLWQRILNIGSISLETAGETSSLTMDSIDSPHRRADAILEAAHKRAADAGL